MWELRDAGCSSDEGRREFETIRKALEGFEIEFGRSALEETAQITKLLQENAISGVAARWAQEASSITRAIDSMKAPWLDIHDKIRSITGLAEMQGIGLALQNVQGFEDTCRRCWPRSRGLARPDYLAVRHSRRLQGPFGFLRWPRLQSEFDGFPAARLRAGP